MDCRDEYIKSLQKRAQRKKLCDSTRRRISMTNQPIRSSDYRDWLKDIKQRVRQAQVKAAVQVNRALLTFYWELGADIVERQKSAKWGSGFLKLLSEDLIAEFPNMKGFSKRNLECIRQWYLFYSEGIPDLAASCGQIAQKAVAQLPEPGKNGPQSKGQKVVA
jgi:hypothetical protein